MDPNNGKFPARGGFQAGDFSIAKEKNDGIIDFMLWVHMLCN